MAGFLAIKVSQRIMLWNRPVNSEVQLSRLRLKGAGWNLALKRVNTTFAQWSIMK
jgi:hypothetical protein